MQKIVLLIWAFLLSATVVPASAQERIAGVSVGDRFKYGEFTVGWSSNDPLNPTFPPTGREDLREMNETEWKSVSVQAVALWHISFQTVKHFKDGTEKTEDGSLYVNSRQGSMTYMAISANLGVNDRIYTLISPNWKINETVTRTYPDGERETNHVNITREIEIIRITDSLTINGTSHQSINYY